MNFALATDAPALILQSTGGHEEALGGLEELPSALAKITGSRESRLVVKGEHKVRSAVHLNLRQEQRLVIEGTDAVLDLGEVPQDDAALCLDAGQFELRGLTLRNGPAWSVQVALGVRYHLAQLRILDARGGGIAVWGPCGLDQEGPAGNEIERCLIERFNTLGAKWTHDAISVRDNRATVACNLIRDSPTETMGIRVMGSGNRIEGNFLQNVATGDAGAMYLWGGAAIYTAVGNLVEHNIVVGTGRGIYLDDGTSAARVEQNYLIDCSEAAVFIGGGRDNVVRENIALRCPLFAHLDNRRAGWSGLPEKAAMFSAARVRLQSALRQESLRDRLVVGGLDVKAFETLSETDFNQPAGNRLTRNIVMPPAPEIQWQNYANPAALVGSATDLAFPNRLLPVSSNDWRQLSGQALDIAKMPKVAELLQALPEP